MQGVESHWCCVFPSSWSTPCTWPNLQVPLVLPTAPRDRGARKGGCKALEWQATSHQAPGPHLLPASEDKRAPPFTVLTPFLLDLAALKDPFHHLCEMGLPSQTRASMQSCLGSLQNPDACTPIHESGMVGPRCCPGPHTVTSPPVILPCRRD